MKPQNYSLKFQNSLADSRITPGSQHGKEPASKGLKARNGHRVPRKLTKNQQRLSQSKIVKPQKAAKLNCPAISAGKSTLEKEAALAAAFERARAVEKSEMDGNSSLNERSVHQAESSRKRT